MIARRLCIFTASKKAHAVLKKSKKIWPGK
jgi:hypothetical protein